MDDFRYMERLIDERHREIEQRRRFVGWVCEDGKLPAHFNSIEPVDDGW